MSDIFEINVLSAADIRRHIGDLSEVLVDCVHGGAGVSFMLPLKPDEGASHGHCAGRNYPRLRFQSGRSQWGRVKTPASQPNMARLRVSPQ
jgi:hypothetical protein